MLIVSAALNGTLVKQTERARSPNYTSLTFCLSDDRIRHLFWWSSCKTSRWLLPIGSRADEGPTSVHVGRESESSHPGPSQREGNQNACSGRLYTRPILAASEESIITKRPRDSRFCALAFPQCTVSARCIHHPLRTMHPLTRRGLPLCAAPPHVHSESQSSS